MKIDKVINNNLVSSHNENNKSVLIMGCGLGFKKKSGDIIDESLIEKVYVFKDKKDTNRLATLLEQVSPECIRVADSIVSYAKSSLKKKLNDNIYITLTDHISFAIERQQQGFFLKNALLWDIKKYYNHEYLIGKEALEIIRQQLGITLPEDEAGYIALHLVTASMETGDLEQVTASMKIIQDILQIIKYYFHMNLDEYSLHYERLLTHLKFFAERILSGNNIDSGDKKLVQIIQNEYQEAFKCSLKIGEYIQKNYGRKLTEDEMVYLTVHIARVTA